LHNTQKSLTPTEAAARLGIVGLHHRVFEGIFSLLNQVVEFLLQLHQVGALQTEVGVLEGAGVEAPGLNMYFKNIRSLNKY
jgi:hypothetical protein